MADNHNDWGKMEISYRKVCEKPSDVSKEEAGDLMTFFSVGMAKVLNFIRHNEGDLLAENFDD